MALFDGGMASRVVVLASAGGTPSTTFAVVAEVAPGFMLPALAGLTAAHRGRDGVIRKCEDFK